MADEMEMLVKDTLTVQQLFTGNVTAAHSTRSVTAAKQP